jgi:hypothetical protein
MGDGHLNKCKSCTKNDSAEREEKLRQDPAWVESEKVRAREKYHRLGYRELHKPTTEQKREVMKRHNKKFPEKKKARIMAQHLVPKTPGNELHHWSYNKDHWKDVIELSVAEHNKLHRYILYDPERMMYRRCDTNVLLDTKESHIAYFNEIKDKE